jgi:GTP-binding protein
MAVQNKPSERASGQQSAAPQRSGRPLVAIVGRPNVGKSALFNRLLGSRLAIVEDRPGVTRDRLYADATAYGRDFILIDTGGFDPESDDPLKQSIASQVQIAISEADVVICVFDGALEPMPADREAVKLLRSATVPVLYVANKIDNNARALHANDLYRLGIDRLHDVSALHGHGIGDLEQTLLEVLPKAEARAESEDEGAVLPRVAIVGRPNAGKSSIVNRLLGKERQIVDDRPGTTVDSVDTLYDREGDPFVLIDTAGIRRKRSVDAGLEGLAVMQAIRSVERSHTVILMIDANEGAAEQDAKIAGLAMQRGRALAIVLNKMDLLDAKARDVAEKKAREVFSFAAYAPVLRLSAKNGHGVPGLLKAIRTVTANHHKRVKTGEINRFFEEVLAHHPPPTSGGRSVRLYYVTQARTAPPTFVISSNHPDRVHFSYQRYVVNQIRERFGFDGTPVRVHYRAHKKES